MKRFAAVILCCLFILSAIGFAQQQSPMATNPDPASREQILKMMGAMQARKTINSVMEIVAINMNQQAEKMIPDAPPEMRAEMSAAMQDMMKDMQPLMADMIDEMVPVYQKYLTRQEADAITAFYLSPEGQSFLTKMPVIMNDSMSTIMASLNTKMEPLTEKMTKRMEEISKKYAAQLKQQSSTSPKPAGTKAKTTTGSSATHGK